MKVLIATPIYAAKDYCLEKHLEHIVNIEGEFDHIMVDNTADNGEYAERLKKLGVKVFRVPRGNNSRDALANSMNFIRTYADERKIDYVLIIESDLFPDKDVLNRLLNHAVNNNYPVVGSFYLLGFKKDTEKYDELVEKLQNNEITWDEWKDQAKGLQPQRACLFKLQRKPSGLMGTKNLTPKESKQAFGRGLQKYHGVGLGCTLIRTDILKRFPFWYDDRFDNKHPDVYFYLELQNAGIPVYVDTNYNIPHQPSKWEEVKDR
jgi:GT2 family glycosyltransferase